MGSSRQGCGSTSTALCADLAVGGITPSAGLIEWAVRVAHAGGMAAHVLIRPRGGDFVSSADEEDVMARDVRAAREAGADGVVIEHSPRPVRSMCRLPPA